MLLGTASTARKGLARLSISGLQTNLDLKALAVIRATFAPNLVHRSSGPLCLKLLLQCGFVVTQRGTGAQFFCQLLHGLAHHISPGECLHRLQPTIKEDRTENSFHRVREHCALAPEPASVFSSAQAQVIAEANLRRHLGHMLPAHKLRPHSCKFALAPLRMHQEQSFSYFVDDPRTTEKLQALVVPGS